MRRALLTLLAALAFAGCGTLRGGAVPETSPCAQAIPLANARVHGRGRLLTARSLGRRQAQRLLASGALGPAASTPAPPKACLLVYRGRFPARYLVLLIRVRRPAVLARLATDVLPRAVRAAT